MVPADGLWVFAYGSLMWDPGFSFERSAPSVLAGHHRAFCVLSMSHRGTRERPGLVLGLAPGGACRGVAYRVSAARVAEVQAYLFEREMRRYEVYRETILPVRLADGTVRAQTYVVDPAAPGYAGELVEDEIARRILAARGERGPNLDYLLRTMTQLRALGIREPALERIHARAIEMSHARDRIAEIS